MKEETMQAISNLSKPPVDQQSERVTQAKKLLKIGLGAELFHTPEGEAYATIEINGHKENWALRSKGFKTWISKSYFDKTKTSPSAQALQDALTTFEGKAQFEGKEAQVNLRVAKADGKVYIDLADKNWRVIEIDCDGWRVLSDPPVKFRRPRGMLPLAEPQPCDPKEYTSKLKSRLNLESDNDFVLLMAFIMASIIPDGPFPILVLNGEQGTGKSTLVRAIRSLIDPNASPLRREPRSADDLMVSARNNWLVAFDNVSKLSDDMSDDLCRLSTGGGLSKRELFTDDGEIILDAKRPCILNGIEEFVTRGDLADRSIVLNLSVISETKRRREECFWADFDKDRASILGAICTAISTGLREKDSFELSRRPRLADAFHWISATEIAFGWARETCLNTFFENQVKASEAVLFSSPLFKHIQKYARQGFLGTATLLLENIRNDADDGEKRYLPGTPGHLSNKLKRLSPDLKKFAGIEIEFDRTGDERSITLRQPQKNGVMSVTSVIPKGITPRYLPSHDARDANDDDDGDFPSLSRGAQ